ncbi:MAG: hypothetical protein H6Q69_3476, partial [Firmicutes bacterium]|nr:hypothetical protein [Bacillota bacterium]
MKKQLRFITSLLLILAIGLIAGCQSSQ